MKRLFNQLYSKIILYSVSSYLNRLLNLANHPLEALNPSKFDNSLAFFFISAFGILALLSRIN